jgi:hypothetical protein
LEEEQTLEKSRMSPTSDSNSTFLCFTQINNASLSHTLSGTKPEIFYGKNIIPQRKAKPKLVLPNKDWPPLCWSSSRSHNIDDNPAVRARQSVRGLERTGHSTIRATNTDDTSKEFLVVFGGIRHGPPQEFLNDVHVLDLEACAWSHPDISGSPPTGRHGHTAVWLRDPNAHAQAKKSSVYCSEEGKKESVYSKSTVGTTAGGGGVYSELLADIVERQQGECEILKAAERKGGRKSPEGQWQEDYWERKLYSREREARVLEGLLEPSNSSGLKGLMVVYGGRSKHKTCGTLDAARMKRDARTKAVEKLQKRAGGVGMTPFQLKKAIATMQYSLEGGGHTEEEGWDHDLYTLSMGGTGTGWCWTKVVLPDDEPQPPPRFNHAAAGDALGSFMVVFGGRVRYEQTFTALNDLWLLRWRKHLLEDGAASVSTPQQKKNDHAKGPQQNSKGASPKNLKRQAVHKLHWVRYCDVAPPAPRYGHTMCPLPPLRGHSGHTTQILLVGGCTANGMVNENAKADVWVLNLVPDVMWCEATGLLDDGAPKDYGDQKDSRTSPTNAGGNMMSGGSRMIGKSKSKGGSSKGGRSVGWGAGPSDAWANSFNSPIRGSSSSMHLPTKQMPNRVPNSLGQFNSSLVSNLNSSNSLSSNSLSSGALHEGVSEHSSVRSGSDHSSWWRAQDLPFARCFHTLAYAGISCGDVEDDCCYR